MQIASDDGLPTNVCQKCVASIRLAVTYRQMCEQSDAVLRKLFYQHSLNVYVKLERIDVGNDSFTEDVKLEEIDTIADINMKIDNNVWPEESVVAYNFDVIPSNSYEENIWKSEKLKKGQNLSDFRERRTHEKCMKKNIIHKLDAVQMNAANRFKSSAFDLNQLTSMMRLTIYL